ncbi:MAG: efflux RND transporter periplasmic adaptor subunit [Paludibacteraceae bacterium]|nr:efflux RND transporter periplasmic adaptor subunit [Paludibacteraceae bacterium]
MKKAIYLFLSMLIFVGCKQDKKTNDSIAPKVEITEVKSVKATGGLHYSGTIEPIQSIPLTFQTSGTVLQVLVNAGDAVRKGQLLAVVDKADAQNMYEMAKAKYQQAKDAYNRLKEVHDKGSLPEIKWVEMQSNLQQAESSVSLAKNNLKKCAMYAPEAGIIGHRNIEPGMTSIGSTMAPLELIKIQTVYVKIAVPENEISRIHKGLKATFKVSALNDRQFEGIVTNVGVEADQISRTYEVKITVKNTDLMLKPGMVCDVNLDVIASKEIVAVAYQAVDKDKDNHNFVFVVNPAVKTVKKRIVHVGDYQNNDIEVLSGLSVGEKVVCEGKQKLSDNCKISL